eukprot:TRINITY_DN13477_c0_g1_i1.p1 TRINITY_DN13477_c0_g1~~TRINITY_DN13477_c0_g1_i1.p1  ORF type:complete len:879 (-),score=209.19 TRINITY_DN13477_c0_g1_i1:613-3249(-)
MSEPLTLPSTLAILPLSNKVLLPGAFTRVRCASPSSVKLIEHELWLCENFRFIGVLPVRDSQALDSSASAAPDLLNGNFNIGQSLDAQKHAKHLQDLHFHRRGVVARALRLSQSREKPSGRIMYTVELEGLCRFNVQEMLSETNGQGYNTAHVSYLDMTKGEMEQAEKDPEVQVLSHQLKVIAGELKAVLEQKNRTMSLTKILEETAPVHKLADIFVAIFESSFEEQLTMLDATDIKVRLTKATEVVHRYLQKISQKVEGQFPKSQKESRLRQKMRAIKEELGDNDDEDDDLIALERKLQTAGMPSVVKKQAQRELRRLRKMHPLQPSYSSSRSYLELLTDLPWQTSSEEREIDLRAAKQCLDREHYGLEKVKSRIVEYLAVRKLKPDARGPVLCFVGPPGVGKTSLASSIASALNRKFIRISLGGVRDEADIRGHRRTYVGSMPGRLIEGIKVIGVNNPVILLDEVDKTGSDIRGDPASALLEVLDPEQNKTFNDHYLNVPFDLSKVVFVATANRIQRIPAPLLDRMEVIELQGYTPEEKLKIALCHLIPRVLDQHGLTAQQLEISESVVKLIIQRYTREVGVRNLERHLAALARAAAVKVADHVQSSCLPKTFHQNTRSMMEGTGIVDSGDVEMEELSLGVNGPEVSNALKNPEILIVDESLLEKILGPPKFDDGEAAERVSTPGVALGLVCTAFGGEVQFVEMTTMVGKGDIHLTGQLGDVIKESAQLALTWVRSRAADLKLATASEVNMMESRDLHIHFPAGAVPKDGPSAGVTLVTALVSLLSKRKARSDTAMTGEITLRGLVLPVGGVKDKILAAHRYGIKRIILPEKNVKDLMEVPSTILLHVEILLVKRLEEVLNEAFEGGFTWARFAKL